MKTVHLVSLVLAAVGAINWGLLALFDFNLVAWLDTVLGAGNVLADIVYVIVAIAGVIVLVTSFNDK